MLRYFILLLTILPSMLISQTIEGIEEVCLEECQQYTLISNGSGPIIWKSSGGYVQQSADYNATICWHSSGNQILTATDITAAWGEHLAILNVDVLAPLTPEINFPFYPDALLQHVIDHRCQSTPYSHK